MWERMTEREKSKNKVIDEKKKSVLTVSKWNNSVMYEKERGEIIN